MKFVLQHLQLGEMVDAKVAEILDSRELIINIGGDLARARNETARALKPGDLVRLRVAAVNPLKFQVMNESSRRFGRLDLTT